MKLIHQLAGIRNQRKFQKVMGRAEVYIWIMIKLSFRLWLEVDAATYDARFKYRADRAASERIDPFAHFFPEGKQRLYFKPMNVEVPAQFHAQLDPANISVEDRAVVELLQKAGYENIDYIRGYAQKGKRTERIGKILDRLLASDPMAQNIKTAKQRFITAPHRQFVSTSSNPNLWIILTRNPHDIAQMSYTRNWKSCMDIDGGKFCRSPYAIIKSGGLMAYLVNTPESEVASLVDSDEYIPSKIAIARVSIKTAISPTGQPIAVPERRVYPMNIKGFWESINAWLEQRQSAEGGRYKLLGGYTDSYARGSYIHSPRDHSGIYDYLKSSNLPRKKSALDYVFNSNDTFPPVIWDKIKQIIIKQVNNDSPENYFLSKLKYMHKHFPDFFTPEELKNLNYKVKYELGLLSNSETALQRAFIDSDNRHYAKPMVTDKFMELLRTVDTINQEGLSELAALKPVIKWFESGKNLEMYDNSPENKERIVQVNGQQGILANKLLAVLTTLHGHQSSEQFHEEIEFLNLFIERFMSKNNVENVKELIKKVKNYDINLRLKYAILDKYRKLKDTEPEYAQEVAQIYKMITGYDVY